MIAWLVRFFQGKGDRVKRCDAGQDRPWSWPQACVEPDVRAIAERAEVAERLDEHERVLAMLAARAANHRRDTAREGVEE